MDDTLNRIHNAMGDYTCSLTAKDVPISVRRELLKSENRTYIESIKLCASLNNFKMGKYSNIQYDRNVWTYLSNLLDELVSIQYSILYYINPKLITAVTEGSRLIPIIPIEDVLKIGDYCDSIISNGIQELKNYNNSILYLLEETGSDLLKYINRTRVSDITATLRDTDGNVITSEENQIQHDYLKYLGVYSFIYTSMYKLMSKYIDSYNELHSFSNMVSYYIGISSYVILRVIPQYNERHVRISKSLNRIKRRLRLKYSDSILYTPNIAVIPGERNYDKYQSLFLFEMINGSLTENMCSKNITFDEFAFLSIYGMSVYNESSIQNTFDKYPEYKLRAFAKVTKFNDSVIKVNFYFQIYQSTFRSSDRQRFYTIYITDFENIDPNMLNVILKEVGYNFNKYVIPINKIALTLKSKYVHSLLDGIVINDSRTKENMNTPYEKNITYLSDGTISINDIPNISDLNNRAIYLENKVNSYADRFIKN